MHVLASRNIEKKYFLILVGIKYDVIDKENKGDEKNPENK